jgi:hypothetical protein
MSENLEMLKELDDDLREMWVKMGDVARGLEDLGQEDLSQQVYEAREIVGVIEEALKLPELFPETE